jgi:hypothetical protein
VKAENVKVIKIISPREMHNQAKQTHRYDYRAQKRTENCMFWRIMLYLNINMPMKHLL